MGVDSLCRSDSTRVASGEQREKVGILGNAPIITSFPVLAAN